MYLQIILFSRVIYLRCCLGVSRMGSSRKGHTVVLYAKHQTMVLVVENQWEQEEWYLAIKKLMEEERRDEEHGEGIAEEDDGYCTLPPAAFFKEVRPGFTKYGSFFWFFLWECVNYSEGTLNFFVQCKCVDAQYTQCSFDTGSKITLNQMLEWYDLW